MVPGPIPIGSPRSLHSHFNQWRLLFGPFVSLPPPIPSFGAPHWSPHSHFNKRRSPHPGPASPTDPRIWSPDPFIFAKLFQKHIWSKNKKRLRRTHWAQKLCFSLKSRFAFQITHFTKQKSACSVRAGLKIKQEKIWTCTPNYILRNKKSACHVRAGLKI